LQLEHWTFLCENGFKCFFRPTVAADTVGTARAALKYLKEQGCDAIFLHFDVDVIDSGEFPLANYPHYACLEFGHMRMALDVFLAEAEDLIGMVITEVNPNNDPDGSMVDTLTDAIATAFAHRIAARHRDKDGH